MTTPDDARQRPPTSGALADASGSSTHGLEMDPWLRAAALAGVLTLPLALIGLTMSDLSGNAGLNPGSPDEEMLSAYADYEGRFWVSASLLAAAAVCTWVFLGALWTRVRAGSEWLAVVAVLGGCAAGTLLVSWSGMSLVAAVAADYEDVDTARFLMVAGWETARLSVGPYLVMVGAATVAGFRYGVFGGKFNWFGLAFTVLLVFGLVPFSPAGLMGLLATVWVLVAGLVLAFGRPPAPLRLPA